MVWNEDFFYDDEFLFDDEEYFCNNEQPYFAPDLMSELREISKKQLRLFKNGLIDIQ